VPLRVAIRNETGGLKSTEQMSLSLEKRRQLGDEKRPSGGGGLGGAPAAKSPPQNINPEYLSPPEYSRGKTEKTAGNRRSGAEEE